MIFCKHPPFCISLFGWDCREGFVHSCSWCIINALSMRAESIPKAQGVNHTNSKLLNPTDHPLASIFAKSRRSLCWSWNQTPISHIPSGIGITSPQLWLYSLLCEPGRFSTKLHPPKSGKKTSGRKLLVPRNQRHHNLTPERCIA